MIIDRTPEITNEINVIYNELIRIIDGVNDIKQ